MRKLIFVTGGAGAGKTTVAKTLARRSRIALFDMDTLSRPVSDAIMRLSGLDPNDRDSDLYKSRCRDLGYRITMDAALENVDIGTDVMVIGPFTKELSDPLWLERELARIGATLQDVDVKVMVVYLQDEKLYRKRIQARSLAIDAWKLEHWHDFSRTLGRKEISWNLQTSSILYFDNSGTLSEKQLSLLEQFLA